MTAFQIASLLFPDVKMSPLNKEMLVVNDYLKAHAPNLVKNEEASLGDTYSPPATPLSAIRKINKYTSEDLKVDRLTMNQKNHVESVIAFLQAPRFNTVINNYNAKTDRELFEAEFIRSTWDKPDLTSDEINLYINICVDYINLKNISAHIEKLNRMFNEAEEQQDMSIRLAELLKTKSEEYNQCEKRIESLIMRLNGDRAKRIASKQQENASILNLVQLFQDEEERKIMIQIAELQKRAVEEKADELEKMPEWKARVLGITKNNAI
jgi:phage gpG-like protein